LDGHPYRVGGIAVSAAAPVYPLTANFYRPGGGPPGFPTRGSSGSPSPPRAASPPRTRHWRT
jgi:hypothetical protein